MNHPSIKSVRFSPDRKPLPLAATRHQGAMVIWETEDELSTSLDLAADCDCGDCIHCRIFDFIAAPDIYFKEA